MFWLTLTLVFLMGLIARPLIRRFLQNLFPRVQDRHFDVLVIILLLVVSVLSVVKHRDDEAKKVAIGQLENRTREVERLPDGRSRFGVMVTGKPAVILEEHDRAVAKFTAGDFVGALAYSQRAIQAHEETLKILSKIADYGKDGSAYLPVKETAKLYDLAAMCAERLGKGELSALYRQKSEEHLSQAKEDGNGLSSHRSMVLSTEEGN